VTSNLTTNEDIKGSYSNKRTHGNYNPFNEGNGILNCNYVLCSPLPPSLIDLRGRATEEHIAQKASASLQKNGEIISPSIHQSTMGNLVMQNYHPTNEVTTPGGDAVAVSYGKAGVVIDNENVYKGETNRRYSQVNILSS